MGDIYDMDGKMRRGRGVQFNPTDEHRQIVRGMASVGISRKTIAKILKIDTKTLNKYFGEELNEELAKNLENVARSMFAKAIDGDVRAGMFILRTQAGWSEKRGTAGEGEEDQLPYAPRDVKEAEES